MIIMDSLQNILETMWLTSPEIEIFMICQKYGRLSATWITRYMHMPRSTVYGYIEKLCEKWLLVSTKGTQGNYFTTISPDELIALLQNQKNTYNEMIERLEIIKPTLLQEIHNQKNLPQVKYYEWIESVAVVYDKTNKGEIKCYLSDIDAILSSLWRDIKKLVREFIKNKWYYKEILIDSPNARAYVREKNKIVKKKNYQTKFLKWNVSLKSSNCLIDNTYFHIAYDNRVTALEINNPIFYGVQKMLFDMLWEQL
jgi:sugar-specific transcriptional regulator TrmB